MSVSAAEPRFPARQGEDFLLQKHSGRHRQIHNEGRWADLGEEKGRHGDWNPSGTYVILSPICEFIHQALLLHCLPLRCCQHLTFSKSHHVFITCFHSGSQAGVSGYSIHFYISVSVWIGGGCVYFSRGVEGWRVLTMWRGSYTHQWKVF